MKSSGSDKTVVLRSINESGTVDGGFLQVLIKKASFGWLAHHRSSGNFTFSRFREFGAAWDDPAMGSSVYISNINLLPGQVMGI